MAVPSASVYTVESTARWRRAACCSGERHPQRLDMSPKVLNHATTSKSPKVAQLTALIPQIHPKPSIAEHLKAHASSTSRKRHHQWLAHCPTHAEPITGIPNPCATAWGRDGVLVDAPLASRLAADKAPFALSTVCKRAWGLHKSCVGTSLSRLTEKELPLVPCQKNAGLRENRVATAGTFSPRELRKIPPQNSTCRSTTPRTASALPDTSTATTG